MPLGDVPSVASTSTVMTSNKRSPPRKRPNRDPDHVENVRDHHIRGEHISFGVSASEARVSGINSMRIRKKKQARRR